MGVVQYLSNARVILTTAILSIIMTAPLFAVLMTTLSSRLLDDDRPALLDVEAGSVASTDDGCDQSTIVDDDSDAASGADSEHSQNVADLELSGVVATV